MVTRHDELGPHNHRPAKHQHDGRADDDGWVPHGLQLRRVGHPRDLVHHVRDVLLPEQRNVDGDANRNDDAHKGREGVADHPHKDELVPAGAELAPAEEEELVHAEPFGLVRRPGHPRGRRVEDHDARGAEAEDGAHDDVARRDAAKVAEGVDEVEVHGEEGQRMQLLALAGIIPLDLRVPVVGQEANVGRAVVADAADELGGREHETRVKEPSVRKAEAVNNVDNFGHVLACRFWRVY